MLNLLAAFALIKRKNASGASSIRDYVNLIASRQASPTPTPPPPPQVVRAPPLELLHQPPHIYDYKGCKEQVAALERDDRDEWCVKLTLTADISPQIIKELFYETDKDASELLCRILRGYIECNKLDKVTKHAFNEYFHAHKDEFTPITSVTHLPQLKLIMQTLNYSRQRLFIKSCLLIINQPSLF